MGEIWNIFKKNPVQVVGRVFFGTLPYVIYLFCDWYVNIAAQKVQAALDYFFPLKRR